MRAIQTLAVALALVSHCAFADIAVIVNPANSTKQLNRQQLTKLYMGRTRTFDNGSFVVVIDQPRDAPLRERFFMAVVGMTQPQVNAYWSRLAFSGQVLPPQALPDDQAIVKFVRSNPSAIGYVQAESVDAGVRVVLTIKD